MKKSLLLLASAALLLVGCAKENFAEKQEGELVTATFTASLDNGVATRAAVDHDGAAANVTRWIMEVRDASGEVYSYMKGTETAGTLQHTFNIKLFKNQKYTFAFWADNGDEYYDASDLSAVKYADGKAVVASVDAKDAFSGAETLTFTESITRSITLHRPFAQLNVITKDLADLRSDIVSTEVYNAFKPKKFKTTITVPTQFDVLKGEASAETELILAADEFYGKDPVSYEKAPEQATMFMAYIFATEGEKDVRNINFKFDVDSQTGNNTFDFEHVPFQRNYRTNILGNFLSGDATWTVIIEEEWGGEYDYPPIEAGSIEAANASLAAGETNISITNPSDFATVNLTIPDAANDKDIIIEVADKADMDLKVDANTSTPKSISLSAGTAKSLVVNAPASHVELTAGEYKTVDAKTSATTLVVGKDTKITETLTIKEGNAVIDGTVKTFVNETGAALVWNVANTAELANAVKFAGAGDEIKVAAGTYSMPAKVETSGLKISGEGGAVLECPKETVYIKSDNVTLHDLTIKCNTQNTDDVGALNISESAELENVTFTGDSKKIVVVGGTDEVKFTNCRFENAGKGRAIMVWGGSPTITVDGCYFDNIYPFNVDGGNPIFVFTKSSLNGWCSWGKGTVSFDGCDFGKSTSGYAYCRPYQNLVFSKCNFFEDYKIDFGAAGIEIDLNGCKLNGQPMTVDILDLAELSHAGILRIDGVEVFPITTFEVSSVGGLKSAITCVNDLKRAGEYTIILNDGVYEVSDLVLWQNVTGKSLVIEAAEGADVTIKPVASGNKSPYIFLVAGGSSYDATRAISFNGIKFDYTQAADIVSAPVYCCVEKDPYVKAIENVETNDTRYAHNITFNNCSLSVFSKKTENISFIAGPAGGSPKDVAFYYCTMTNGGYIHSGYINGIICDHCTVTGVKALINSQCEATDYTIIIRDNTVNAWHNYIIRTSGGKVNVENNVFAATYSGSDANPGVVVLRVNASEATITGDNTFTKSSISMWDCYCSVACTVNGETKTAGTGINFQ